MVDAPKKENKINSLENKERSRSRSLSKEKNDKKADNEKKKFHYSKFF